MNQFCNDGSHNWSLRDEIVYCNDCKVIQEFAKGFPKPKVRAKRENNEYTKEVNDMIRKLEGYI
jgi:hypothetical protein